MDPLTNHYAAEVLEEIRQANQDRDNRIEAARENARIARGEILNRIKELQTQLSQLDAALGTSHSVDKATAGGSSTPSARKLNQAAAARMFEFLHQNKTKDYGAGHLCKTFFSHTSPSAASQYIYKLRSAGKLSEGSKRGTYCWPLKGGIA